MPAAPAVLTYDMPTLAVTALSAEVSKVRYAPEPEPLACEAPGVTVEPSQVPCTVNGRLKEMSKYIVYRLLLHRPCGVVVPASSWSLTTCTSADRSPPRLVPDLTSTCAWLPAG